MARFVSVLLCVTMAGLLYVHSEVEAVKIGYRINRLEEMKALAIDRARALQYNIARLKAPRNLERRLETQRITLEAPKAWQTLVLPGAVNAGMAVPASARMPFFTRLFVGTAQAEAKESSSR